MQLELIKYKPSRGDYFSHFFYFQNHLPSTRDDILGSVFRLLSYKALVTDLKTWISLGFLIAEFLAVCYAELLPLFTEHDFHNTNVNTLPSYTRGFRIMWLP